MIENIIRKLMQQKENLKLSKSRNIKVMHIITMQFKIKQYNNLRHFKINFDKYVF